MTDFYRILKLTKLGTCTVNLPWKNIAREMSSDLICRVIVYAKYILLYFRYQSGFLIKSMLRYFLHNRTTCLCLILFISIDRNILEMSILPRRQILIIFLSKVSRWNTHLAIYLGATWSIILLLTHIILIETKINSLPVTRIFH